MHGQQVAQLIALAESICQDQLSSGEAFRELKKYSAATGPVGDVVHLLYHFVSDADIRAKDPKYCAVQQDHLRSAIDSLKGL
jgi:hypothetical protein